MGYQEHKHKAPKSISCAVLTISDTRTERDDESGRLIRQKLSETGHRVILHCILKNEADSIREKIYELLKEEELQAIIATGGTGVSRRDITVETIYPILEKKLDGFGELFRFLTYSEIGTGSIMSRAIAGVAEGKVILCLPGSLEAAKLAMNKIILPELGHLVMEATR
ncbi:MAG TPA: molybdenum cofactor biosynthesis protein [Dehalococcoidia bacterium]|jgi:molybdenum cofactor biosynthesis protein B|nr:molybdenum cofactor biosynthesis protein [Dehalococcoidia bacterium]